MLFFVFPPLAAGKTDEKIADYTKGNKCFRGYVDIYGVDVSSGTCSYSRLEGEPDDCAPVTSSDEVVAYPKAALYKQFLGE